MSEYLYHYTTLEALESISKTSLRMSNIVKLKGDPFEMHHGLDVFLHTLMEQEIKSADENKKGFYKVVLRKIIEQLAHQGRNEIFPSLYSLSLSEDINNQYLWNTYAKNGEGVALKINTSKLPLKSILNFKKINYDVNTLINNLIKIIDESYPSIMSESKVDENNYIIKAKNKHITEMNSKSILEFAYYKPQRIYINENEWRYVIRPEHVGLDSSDQEYINLPIKNSELIHGIIPGENCNTNQLMKVWPSYIRA
ncbi:DUF2971 domain-containing protein [bacterium]|nr:DUF2971 domain-containing protein [bacterium]